MSSYNSAPQSYGGLQAQSPNQASPLTSKEQTPLIVYLLFVTLVELIGIVDLSLHTWIRYCDARFSLTYLYSDEFTDVSLSDLIDDCYDGYTDGPCGDVCSNLKHIRDAGNTMLWLGAISIALTAISAVSVVILVFTSKRFMGIAARLLLPTGMAIWIIGTVVYIALFAQVSNNASNETNVEAGMGLAIANAVLHVVCCLLGYVAASRLVTRWWG